MAYLIVSAGRIGLMLAAPLLLLALLVMPPVTQAGAVPAAALRWQAELTRAAQYSYGLHAPVATLAAMVHQESRWQPEAVSPAGAQGLAQFMPATAEWMAEQYPLLGDPAPHDPRWSLQAMVLYTAWLNNRIQARSPCDKWAMVLSAYNGGIGWLRRDQRLASASGADQLAWFNATERFNAGRSAANFAENRHYPTIILQRWTPLYHHEGWGPGVCAERWAL